MKLSHECVMLQTELKKFAQQVLADRVDELEKSCGFPLDSIKRLAQMGILGAIIPEAQGGAALDTIGFAVVLEEIGKVCPTTAFIVASHNAFFAFPLLKFGSAQLQEKYLPKAATGEIIGAFALPKTNELKYEKSADGYRITGKNPFVINAAANGPVAVTVPDPESDGLNVSIVENGNGCKFSKNINTLGLRSAGIGEYIFENCRIPAENIIAQAQQGQKVIDTVNDYARILLAAISLGIAEGATDAAVKYAKERVQFNQPIISFGMVREQVAEIAVKIEAARHLVYDAALRMDRGEDYRTAAAMAKLLAGQTATSVTTAVIQIYGGYGYIKDYPAERYFRDAQMLNVVCSTPDEDKETIAQGIT